MKRNLLTALSLIACFTTFSQEEVKNQVKEKEVLEMSNQPNAGDPKPVYQEVKKNSSVTVSKRRGEAQQVHDHAYYVKEIAAIDNNLSAIDQKITYVNNNPQEKLQAESNGWFQQMEDIKTQLNTKKIDLQEKLAKL